MTRSPHHTLVQAAQVALHVPQERPELAGRDVQLLLGLRSLGGGAVTGLQLRPQHLQGALLRLPAPQISLENLGRRHTAVGGWMETPPRC